MKIVSFFNNRGGIGKASLVYHLAWMYADLGLRVVVADLDPQANLTSMFIEEERQETLWLDGEHPDTIFGAIHPTLSGVGDIAAPHLEEVDGNIGVIVGDLGLSRFEEKFSDAWAQCLNRDEAAFSIVSAFYRTLLDAGERWQADIVLVDVGPNLGAINRAAIIATQYVVVPLAPDLLSLQGLRNLGPTLRRWRMEWNDRLSRDPNLNFAAPPGEMTPLGYVVLQHAIRLDRPVKAYGHWMARIPAEYRRAVLDEPIGDAVAIGDDPLCLALLKHYRSLMPMAMEARKPMFHLKPADGAIGAHATAVQRCRLDFERLARNIAVRVELTIS